MKYLLLGRVNSRESSCGDDMTAAHSGLPGARPTRCRLPLVFPWRALSLFRHANVARGVSRRPSSLPENGA
jgi:hypothetical protein